MAQIRSLRGIIWAVTASLSVLQVGGCVVAEHRTPAETQPLLKSNVSTQSEETPVIDIGGPPRPHMYFYQFEPRADAIAGKYAQNAQNLSSQIARDYQRYAFPTVFVFSIIAPSDSPASPQEVAWARAEWVTHQLVIAGVPRQNINETVLSHNTLFSFSGVGLKRLVVIEGYPSNRVP